MFFFFAFLLEFDSVFGAENARTPIWAARATVLPPHHCGVRLNHEFFFFPRLRPLAEAFAGCVAPRAEARVFVWWCISLAWYARELLADALMCLLFLISRERCSSHAFVACGPRVAYYCA